MTSLHRKFQPIVLLLHLVFIALAAPATLDQSLATIQSGNTKVFDLAKARPGIPVLISNATNVGDDENYAIHIPGTTVYLDLYYFPLVTIDRDALRNTLLNAQWRLRAEILAYGNGPLDPDPYQTPRVAGENATMTAKSWTNPQTGVLNKMTTQTVWAAAKGMYEFLFYGQRHGSVIANVIDNSVVPGPEKCGTMAVRPFGD